MGRVNDQSNPSQPRPAADAEVSEEDLRAQWQDLADRIRAAREAYYGGDTQLMSDAAFDELLRDLQALETTHPFLQRDDSPTQEVGGTASPLFTPVHHAEQMLSLDNTFTVAELRDWLVKTQEAAGREPGWLRSE